jgi:calcineurin-like phosphoesterase family protein
MDRHLIDQINLTVGEQDILYILGDFCFGTRNSDKIGQWAQSYRDKINCKEIYLIWGNHDNRKIRWCFSNAYDRYELNWQGKNILLTHCAHAVWERSHYGAWHLYGHSHTTAERSLDLFFTKFFQNLTKCTTVGEVRNLVDALGCSDQLLINTADFISKRFSLDVGVDNANRLFGEYRPLSLDEIRVYFEGRSGISIDNGKA